MVLSEKGRIKITHNMILIAMIIFLLILMSLLSRRFFTVYNLTELTRNFIEIGIIALPMTMIVITGGIDLSVESIMGWSAIMFGLVFYASGSVFLSCLSSCLTGIVAGAFNGWLIGKIKMPPLVVTLATMYVYRGLALGISQAVSYSGYPESFFFLGQGNIWIFPTQLIIFALLAVVFNTALKRTAPGRFCYAIGNNENASHYAGIKVKRIKYVLYSLSGLMSSFASIIFVSRISTAKANAGEGFTFDVITVVVLGGTSISGGVGGISGTILALIIVGILKNGLSLARVPNELVNIIIGVILIVSVISNVFSDMSGNRKSTKARIGTVRK